uniref:Uncharacterized protein n=1 Tax=Chromera velia CCMP2878 TaxID=1169474 RepID=A0A0G4F1X1_9ALVE|eukprot:Cvel_14563.t1-p1 / transcript=Cvel_14563.t1 / gene=Cvel_14563 / organism=Chromera_velia_CCMP2878 / gene_product=hypothetical protein / transcript_product=hypothetical protein / location=Cvel_scaffold1041:3031-6054(+) / protein_length=345 / sequence_SO=supercontig / SO=protein_coding / is_pseudo=false
MSSIGIALKQHKPLTVVARGRNTLKYLLTVHSGNLFVVVPYEAGASLVDIAMRGSSASDVISRFLAAGSDSSIATPPPFERALSAFSVADWRQLHQLLSQTAHNASRGLPVWERLNETLAVDLDHLRHDAPQQPAEDAEEDEPMDRGEGGGPASSSSANLAGPSGTHTPPPPPHAPPVVLEARRSPSPRSSSPPTSRSPANPQHRPMADDAQQQGGEGGDSLFPAMSPPPGFCGFGLAPSLFVAPQAKDEDMAVKVKTENDFKVPLAASAAADAAAVAGTAGDPAQGADDAFNFMKLGGGVKPEENLITVKTEENPPDGVEALTPTGGVGIEPLTPTQGGLNAFS